MGRTLAVGLSAAAFTLLFWLAMAGAMPWMPGVLALLLVLTAGLLVERWRYKRIGADAPGPGWEATAERFIDPGTGAPLPGWYQPATGARCYVSDPA